MKPLATYQGQPLPDPGPLLAFLRRVEAGNFDSVGPFEVWLHEHRNKVKRAAYALLDERAFHFRHALEAMQTSPKYGRVAFRFPRYLSAEGGRKSWADADFREALQTFLTWDDLWLRALRSTEDDPGGHLFHRIAVMLGLMYGRDERAARALVEPLEEALAAATREVLLANITPQILSMPDPAGAVWAAAEELRLRKRHRVKERRNDLASAYFAQPSTAGKDEFGPDHWRAVADTLSDIDRHLARAYGVPEVPLSWAELLRPISEVRP